MFNSAWYNSLIKPALTPPDAVYPLVWAVLYVLMFTALLIYIIKPYRAKNYGYIFFIVQLGLNLSWSPVFFSMRDIGFALLVIFMLDLFLLLTIKEFYNVSKISGMLLVPYLIWVLFATYLNIAYFVLN